MSTEIENALKTLEEAFKKDADYAHSWHCNIAMSFFDSVNASCIDQSFIHIWANDGASRFMKQLFNIETEA